MPECIRAVRKPVNARVHQGSQKAGECPECIEIDVRK